MGDPILVVLEGPDGAGKTHHARELANALVERGITAQSWNHDRPPFALRDDAWGAALHYAIQRVNLSWSLCEKRCAARVVIADRWVLSTLVLGLATDSDALVNLAGVEATQAAMPALTVVLTAPEDVLDGRLWRRAEGTTPLDREKREIYRAYARQNKLPVLETHGDAAAVTERLVELVRGVLP